MASHGTAPEGGGLYEPDPTKWLEEIKVSPTSSGTYFTLRFQTVPVAEAQWDGLGGLIRIDLERRDPVPSIS
jgi:hypothetical protein